ncbi:hypothetical protein [Kitasatospora sp. NPDC097643]|uniref:hypothetical protein n=1 Tax=Kitasatospora sp. NPDC097643 TaxID=3157230 RepID=UPI00331A923E
METEEQCDTILPDESVMRPGVQALCDQLGLAELPLTHTPPRVQRPAMVLRELKPSATTFEALAEEWFGAE